MGKLTSEEINSITVDEEEIKVILTENNHENRPYIIAIIGHFCKYATREWNATEIDDNVIKEYVLSMCGTQQD